MSKMCKYCLYITGRFFSCYGPGAISAGKHNVGQATVPPKGVKVGTASDIHFAMHAA
jgi:hypothetical protein